MELILTATNLIIAGLSVSGIIHLLQTRFPTSKLLQTTHPLQYYTLRGSFAILAAAQVATILQPPCPTTMVTTICVGAITHIISSNFE